MLEVAVASLRIATAGERPRFPYLQAPGVSATRPQVAARP